MSRNSFRHSQARIRFTRRFFYALTIAVFSPTSIAADSSTDAQQLINQMSRAAHELNYDGIFVYNRGTRMDTMRLIHRSDKDGEHERLVSMSGNAREIIRDDQGVTCFFPENQEVLVEKTKPRKFFSGQLPEPIETISAFYNFVVAAEGRVAGREAWVVNVVPKDPYRYGYQLWIDKRSKLLLKSILKTQIGVTIEQLMFTQLELLDSIPDESLESELSGNNYTWHEHEYDDVSTDQIKSEWMVNWMPNGFSMSEHEQQMIGSKKMPMNHMIYSDGLAMVSVFIEKLDHQPGFIPGPSQMGGVNTFSFFTDGYQVTVVGEVPKTTVQQMAVSVVHQIN